MITKKQILSTHDMAYIAIFAVLIAVCSWISIPMTVPFTLQTFAVLLTCGLLGGRRGTIAVFIYILLGAVGVPVFSNFQGGLGILLGNTGGYIIGFLFTALFVWLMEKLPGPRPVIQAVSMLLGLFICYAVGTFWFLKVYSAANGSTAIMTVLGWCVFPFILPELLKFALALVLTKRLGKLLP